MTQCFRQLLLFFFSSRRRHTRSLCDWSSDVCSSDLLGELVFEPALVCIERVDRRISEQAPDLAQRHSGRSEEHTSELQSHSDLVCRLLLEKKNSNKQSQQDVKDRDGKDKLMAALKA